MFLSSEEESITSFQSNFIAAAGLSTFNLPLYILPCNMLHAYALTKTIDKQVFQKKKKNQI